MADIFLREDLKHLLKGKRVVFLGDSNVRCYYKDILCLYHFNEIAGTNVFKIKMESTVYNDKLMKHGERTNARNFQEEREFKSESYYFAFYFLTRVYNEYVEELLQRIVAEKKPDVIVINSCLWDMARWGPKGVEEYKVNMVKLMKKLQELVGDECLVIWMTAPPLSQKPHGGFLLVQLDFLQYCLRFHVMEANTYAKQVVTRHGYDVLDIHYHLRMQVQNRCKDGVHWCPVTIRYITNLLLTHISLAWDVPLPRRYRSVIMQRSLADEEGLDEDISQGQETKQQAVDEKPLAKQVVQNASVRKARKKKRRITKTAVAYNNRRQAAGRIRNMPRPPSVVNNAPFAQGAFSQVNFQWNQLNFSQNMCYINFDIPFQAIF